MYVNCDRYIATIMMIIITTLTFKEMNIMILKDIKRHKYNDFEEKFKAINEKIGDNDLINDGADLKFESNVNIDFSKRSSQSL